MRRRAGAALAAVAGLAAVAACGGSSGGGQTVRVSAAASLREALGACDTRIPGLRVRAEFGGSDELAARIRQGVEPDVLAAANMAVPAALAADGLARPPVAFATNSLVLAAPRSSTLRSLADLARRPSLRLAIGSPSVPVGAYTRDVLARLPADRRRIVLGEVRTEEPDVKGIVGKLLAGVVDAGFVYRTDVRATDGRLRALPLPRSVAPAVLYGVSIVRDGPAARRFVADLRHGACARALRAAGFGAPPG